MSPRWLKFLEKFGSRGESPQVSLDDEDLDGSLDNPLVMGRYDVLFDLFGPLAGSPWVPYQCPTLFASIDKCNITPKSVKLSALFESTQPAQTWPWLGPDTMVIVDLPGETTIEIGALLMQKAAQFISTFDHWAFSATNKVASPAIKAQPIIDTMFTLAPTVHTLRKDLSPDVAPVWLCDSRRLGDSLTEPSPGMFDNRYYVDDSILPGLSTLKKGGIRRIVHFREELARDPLPDLIPFITEAHKAGMRIESVALSDQSTWTDPKLMAQPPFETKLPIRGFKRSDMGGFGKMVPVPSEGSYSSGGRGG
jgi:hypothetical protein